MQEDNKQGQPGAVISPGAQITPQVAPVTPNPVPMSQQEEVVINFSQAPTPTPVAPAPEPAPEFAVLPPIPDQPIQAAPEPLPAPVLQQPEPAAFTPPPSQIQPEQPQPEQPAPEQTNFYTPVPIAQQSYAPAPQSDGVSWTASEYVANPKNAGWFMLLGLGTLVLGIVTYLITHDAVSTAAICIFGVIVGVFAARKPQVLNYRVDGGGIQIGPKYYPYSTFKAFSIADEHAMTYVSLLPLRRFMAPIAVHYAPDDEENIINTLSDYLPYEDHKTDFVDSISRRVRF